VDVSYGNMLLEFSAMFATTHGLQPSQATQPPFELLPKESCGSLRRRFEATEHTAVGCAAGGACRGVAGLTSGGSVGGYC
jgi:hypothetical protein